MKRTTFFGVVLACAVLLSACNSGGGDRKTEETVNSDTEITYEEAYREFLLTADIDEDHIYLIYGYSLCDLNFDYIPELLVWHYSGAYRGGYYTLWYFDGDKIETILDDQGKQARIAGSHILADPDNQKVYFLHEMYLLRENENGTYGYVRELKICELKSENGIPVVCNHLKLEVNQEGDFEGYTGGTYSYDDDFLSDSEFDAGLITQQYVEGKWIEISPEQYLTLKRELIPEENSFVNLYDTSVYVLVNSMPPKKAEPIFNIHPSEGKIDELFSEWTWRKSIRTR